MNAPNASNFFSSKVDNMDASNRYPWLPADFLGTVKIDACKGIPLFEGGRAFIVEMVILTSNRPDVHVGGKYSWMQKFNPKNEETANQACIGFLYAALQLTAAQTDAIARVKPKQSQYLNNACSDAQPFSGTIVSVQTSEKPLKSGPTAKNPKGVFTLHTWSPGPADAVA